MSRYFVALFAAVAIAVASPLPARAAPETPAVPPALAAFESAWTGVDTYSATITLFEREGTQVQNSVFDYTFHKPSSATVHYNEGRNAGTTLVWSGGNAVVAHRGSGFVALFKKVFALHDPLVTTIRGSSIDQLSFASILAHSQSVAGAISQDAGPEILGVPTDAVTLVPVASQADGGLTHEIVDISTTTGLPSRVLGYEGSTLVRQVDFSNIKVGRSKAGSP